MYWQLIVHKVGLVGLVVWPNNLEFFFMKPKKIPKIDIQTSTLISRVQTTYIIYCIKMQLKTKKPSVTGLHNNAWKNEKDIDMIC